MLIQSWRVTQPLALVVYEKLMPGSQLVNRLQDINYRVLSLANPSELASAAEREMPMLIFTDVQFTGIDIVDVIISLRQNPATAHIPLVTFGDEPGSPRAALLLTAGATLVVTDAAVLTHLPQLLEQALRLE